METIETYIVRIYRRSRKAPRDISGIVEIIDSDSKEVFASERELREILCAEKSKGLKQASARKHQKK